MKKKAFYSTTEVADICNVHRNTIILAIKKGDLRASSTPGGHNRVAHKDLVKFIRERDLPVIAIPGEDEEAERRQKILVVDDDPAMVRMIEEALEQERYEVRTAGNGYGAGVETARFNPDLILLDYMLPDIDGGQVFATLRESDETRAIRVLVITALEDTAKLESTFGGDVPFLKKPFSPDELKRKVNQVLTTQIAG